MAKVTYFRVVGGVERKRLIHSKLLDLPCIYDLFVTDLAC